MPEDTSADFKSGRETFRRDLHKLKAIDDEQLRGASPEIKREVADVRGEPLEAESNAHSSEDVLQQDTDLATQAQQLEDGLMDNWMRSAESVTDGLGPRSHSVERPRDGQTSHGSSEGPPVRK